MLHVLYYIFVVMTGISSQSTHWYAYWSGIATSVGLFGGIYTLIRKHNCHVIGCHKWLRTAIDPKHGWYACKDHHSMKHHYGVNPHADA